MVNGMTLQRWSGEAEERIRRGTCHGRGMLRDEASGQGTVRTRPDGEVPLRPWRARERRPPQCAIAPETSGTAAGPTAPAARGPYPEPG